MLMVALAAGASPALAGTYVSTQDCRYSHFYGTSNCVWTSTYVPPPFFDPEQERFEATAQAQLDEK